MYYSLGFHQLTSVIRRISSSSDLLVGAHGPALAQTEIGPRDCLVVITLAFDDLGKGNILSYLGDLDGHTLAALGIRDNDDEPTLDTRDPSP